MYKKKKSCPDWNPPPELPIRKNRRMFRKRGTRPKRPRESSRVGAGEQETVGLNCLSCVWNSWRIDCSDFFCFLFKNQTINVFFLILSSSTHPQNVTLAWFRWLPEICHHYIGKCCFKKSKHTHTQNKTERDSLVLKPTCHALLLGCEWNIAQVRNFALCSCYLRGLAKKKKYPSKSQYWHSLHH